MIKSILSFLVLTTAAQTSHALTCGSVDSSVLNDVELYLETLYESGVYEEGLSFHEYPGLSINLKKDGSHYLSVGAAGFNSATRKEILCIEGKLEMQVDFDNRHEVTFKDFQFENGNTIAASVYVLENAKQGAFSKIADFTKEGKKLVYGDLRMFEKNPKAGLLSDQIQLNDYLSITVDSDGEYEIELGALSIYTFKGNTEGATARLTGNILYVEVPTLNLYLDIEVSLHHSNDPEIKSATVFVGALDSVKPAVELGKFN